MPGWCPACLDLDRLCIAHYNLIFFSRDVSCWIDITVVGAVAPSPGRSTASDKGSADPLAESLVS